jgi:hypothetical protein
MHDDFILIIEEVLNLFSYIYILKIYNFFKKKFLAYFYMLVPSNK